MPKPNSGPQLTIPQLSPYINALGLAKLPISPPQALGLKIIPSPSFLLRSGTWKNSNLSPFIGCRGSFSFKYSLVAKPKRGARCHSSITVSFIWALRLEKIPSLYSL